MSFEQKPPRSLQISMQQRIQVLARRTGRSTEHIKNILLMERLIARFNEFFPDTTILKGGLALEFQLSSSRTTKDIDIRTTGSSDKLAQMLKKVEEFRPEPEDHLHFKIEEDVKHPNITGVGVKYLGYRYQVIVTMANNEYARFGLDVSFQDPIYGEPLIMKGDSFFEKYGIPAIEARIYPPPTHLAEKLHAYSCPLEEGRENSRCKDIVDILLLAELLDGVEAEQLYEAFETTFRYRGTHDIPLRLSEPPENWRAMYSKIKNENDLHWQDIDEIFQLVSSFMNPILAKQKGVWSYDDFEWKQTEQ